MYVCMYALPVICRCVYVECVNRIAAVIWARIRIFRPNTRDESSKYKGVKTVSIMIYTFDPTPGPPD
jgi:hypothetical protein